MVVKVPLYKSSYVVDMNDRIITDIWGNYSEYIFTFLKTVDLFKVNDSLFLYFTEYVQSPTEFLFLWWAFKFCIVLLIIFVLFLLFFLLITVDIWLLGGQYFREWRVLNFKIYNILKVLFDYNKIKKRFIDKSTLKDYFVWQDFLLSTFEDYQNYIYFSNEEYSYESFFFYEVTKDGLYDYDFGLLLTNDSNYDYIYHGYKVESLSEDGDDLDDVGLDENEDESRKNIDELFFLEKFFYKRDLENKKKKNVEEHHQSLEDKVEKVKKSIYNLYMNFIEYIGSLNDSKLISEEFREKTDYLRQSSFVKNQELNYKQSLERNQGSFNRPIRFESFGNLYYSYIPIGDHGLYFKNYYKQEELGLKIDISLFYVLIFYSLGLIFLSSVVMLSGYYYIVYMILGVAFWICYGTTDLFLNYDSLYKRGNIGESEFYLEDLGDLRGGLREGYFEYEGIKNEKFFYKDNVKTKYCSEFIYDFELYESVSLNGKLFFEEPIFFDNWLLSIYDMSLNNFIYKKVEHKVFVSWSKKFILSRFKSDYKFVKSFVKFIPLQYTYTKRYEFGLLILGCSIYLGSGSFFNLYNSLDFLIMLVFDFIDLIYSLLELFLNIFQCEEGQPIPLLESRKLIIPVEYLDLGLLLLDLVGDYFLTGIVIIVLLPKLLLWFYFYIWMR